jgi:hypothetical protein
VLRQPNLTPGARLAAGGLASRRGKSRPSIWEPILPKALAKTRLAAWLRTPNPLAWLDHERIHRAIFLCTVSAALLTLALYWGKARAALTDADISRTIHQTEQARDQTYQLRAEWASLNDPSRLRPLAARYLTLHRIDPTQFAALDRLPDRLDHPPPPPDPENIPTITPDPGLARVAIRRALPVQPKKPELPHWLIETHNLRRLLSEPPHTLTWPATVRRYSVLAGQLPAFRHPPKIVAATPSYLGAYTSALGGRAPMPPPQPLN